MPVYTKSTGRLCGLSHDADAVPFMNVFWKHRAAPPNMRRYETKLNGFVPSGFVVLYAGSWRRVYEANGHFVINAWNQGSLIYHVKFDERAPAHPVECAALGE